MREIKQKNRVKVFQLLLTLALIAISASAQAAQFATRSRGANLERELLSLTEYTMVMGLNLYASDCDASRISSLHDALGEPASGDAQSPLDRVERTNRGWSRAAALLGRIQTSCGAADHDRHVSERLAVVNELQGVLYDYRILSDLTHRPASGSEQVEEERRDSHSQAIAFYDQDTSGIGNVGTVNRID